MGPLKRVHAGVRLIHPFPVCVVLLTSAALLVVAHGGVPELGFTVRALTVVLLSQITVGALNDYVDRGRDALTQPDKPIPSGLVTARSALILGLAAGTGLPFAAAGFGVWPVVIAVLGTAAGVAYDLGLKRTILSFLAYVLAFLCLVTWIWLIAERLTPIFFTIYPAGACLLTAAHLANAFPDIESDRSLGQRGLAVVLGPRATLAAILSLYGAVAGTTAILSLLTASLAGLALTLTGSTLALLAAAVGFPRLKHRATRKLVFRAMAPAIALLALGALIALSRA